jgi:hypothetical protein
MFFEHSLRGPFGFQFLANQGKVALPSFVAGLKFQRVPVLLNVAMLFRL